MKRRSHALASGFLLGALTSLPAIAILFLGMRAVGLPFAPFDVFEAITRWLPGRLVTAGIDLMVRVLIALDLGPTSVAAKAAEQLLAIVTTVLLAGLLGVVVAWIERRTTVLRAAVVAALLALVVVVVCQSALGKASAVGIVWSAIVLAAWGTLLAWALTRTRVTPGAGRAERAERRRFLAELAAGSVASAAAIAGISVAWRRGKLGAAGGAGEAKLTSAERGGASGEQGRIAPVRGTRPELTENEHFYRIDINLQPPRVDAATWRLEVDGLVAAPAKMTLADLQAMPKIEQYITLECISNPLGGDLISTSRWGGVRLRDVLARVKPSERARTIQMEATDGYYESLPLSAADDPRIMLVYEMNGEPLPAAHGFPLRIYIPNVHGMKQPKWITRIRLTDADGKGYWVERGWSKEAIVKTTSVIDTVGATMMLGEAKVVGVGGIAYAGARGISKVEIQVDGGPWAEARLVSPPLGPLCWVLWRYDWEYAPGRHAFRVRAYDGTGALQPTATRGPRPDGASGIHELTMTV
jgi:DMSO/TMAO reductase YedYZ molybdopterin-dependent catalytic subunit